MLASDCVVSDPTGKNAGTWTESREIVEQVVQQRTLARMNGNEHEC